MLGLTRTLALALSLTLTLTLTRRRARPPARGRLLRPRPRPRRQDGRGGARPRPRPPGLMGQWSQGSSYCGHLYNVCRAAPRAHTAGQAGALALAPDRCVGPDVAYMLGIRYAPSHVGCLHTLYLHVVYLNIRVYFGEETRAQTVQPERSLCASQGGGVDTERRTRV